MHCPKIITRQAGIHTRKYTQKSRLHHCRFIVLKSGQIARCLFHTYISFRSGLASSLNLFFTIKQQLMRRTFFAFHFCMMQCSSSHFNVCPISRAFKSANNILDHEFTAIARSAATRIAFMQRNLTSSIPLIPAFLLAAGDVAAKFGIASVAVSEYQIPNAFCREPGIIQNCNLIPAHIELAQWTSQ